MGRRGYGSCVKFACSWVSSGVGGGSTASAHQPSKQHLLDIRTEAVEPPPAPLLTQEHAALKRDPYLQRPNTKLLAYVDVFVDDFLGLAQGPRHRRRHVRRTLFHALDKVFWPLDQQDAPAQRSTKLEEDRRRGIAETISFSRATRWGGRAIVMLTESKIHPSRVWQVDQEQSPASSFFKLSPSLRWEASC